MMLLDEKELVPPVLEAIEALLLGSPSVPLMIRVPFFAGIQS